MQQVKAIGSFVTVFLLVLAILITLLPMEVRAAEPESGNTFTFTDSGVTASNSGGSGFKISGTNLTISEPGTYTVTGSCAEGSVTVKKGTTGVTLILKNLTLASSATAPPVLQ